MLFQLSQPPFFQVESLFLPSHTSVLSPNYCGLLMFNEKAILVTGLKTTCSCQTQLHFKDCRSIMNTRRITVVGNISCSAGMQCGKGSPSVWHYSHTAQEPDGPRQLWKYSLSNDNRLKIIQSSISSVWNSFSHSHCKWIFFFTLVFSLCLKLVFSSYWCSLSKHNKTKQVTN